MLKALVLVLNPELQPHRLLSLSRRCSPHDASALCSCLHSFLHLEHSSEYSECTVPEALCHPSLFPHSTPSSTWASPRASSPGGQAAAGSLPLAGLSLPPKAGPGHRHAPKVSLRLLYRVFLIFPYVIPWHSHFKDMESEVTHRR